MAKIVNMASESVYQAEGPSAPYLDSKLISENLLQNITEIIPLVIKNVCENTPAELVNNSDMGQKMIRSIVVSRLTSKFNPILNK